MDRDERERLRAQEEFAALTAERDELRSALLDDAARMKRRRDEFVLRAEADADAAERECAGLRVALGEARAEVERLRGRLGVLERAVLMADGADYDEGLRDCMFCGEDWQEDGHELACPRRMADVIRRERKRERSE